MSTVPKHVVSATPTSLEWNNSSPIGDVAQPVRPLPGHLRKGTGGDILVYGSATRVQALMAHDLVGLYRLLVYPVMVGNGKRLFKGPEQARLKPSESRRLDSGVMMLCCEPDRPPAGS
ncbi:dihydrofolate reductase family protein [Deinococcus sp.]|uniref:dihydrofolate reductase family protein n=1 Tax=Deinococcus sp. TaxID=47478 RepID=UPI003C7CAAB4